MKSKQIIISGKVQGVGFRNFTLRVATQLCIVGWVRNLQTSQVEVFAQAQSDENLNNFIQEIKRGPVNSKVEALEIIDVDSKSSNCDTFTIESDEEKKRVF